MATLQGRRVYPPKPDGDFPHPLPSDYRPGDYWFDPTLNLWLACNPKGSVANLKEHQVEEHEDGTITVSPSILVDHWNKEKCWHGYLKHGVWREV